jgi:hypothetical protein
MTTRANQNRKPVNFKPGQWVLLSSKDLRFKDGLTTNKLYPMFIGPFKIVKTITPVAYELDLPQRGTVGTHPVVHVSRLKPYYWDRPDSPPILYLGPGIEYHVDRISAQRKRPGHEREFFVHWEGLPPSWEPKSNLTNCSAKLQEFLASVRKVS